MFPPPEPDSDDGRHAAEAAQGAARRCWRRCARTSSSVDILTLAPALAAEKAGVPLATLIPHIYPVVEPGLPFFAVGLRAPRTGARARRLAGRAAGAAGRPRARPPRPQPAAPRGSGWRRWSAFTAASAPTWRWSPPIPSSSTRGAGRRESHVTGPMGFEQPHPEIELPPGASAARPGRAEHRPRSRQPARARRRSRALAAEPVRVVATTNRVAPQPPDRGPGRTRSWSTGSATPS